MFISILMYLSAYTIMPFLGLFLLTDFSPGPWPFSSSLIYRSTKKDDTPYECYIADFVIFALGFILADNLLADLFNPFKVCFLAKWPMPVFVNKVLSEHNHAHLLLIV